MHRSRFAAPSNFAADAVPFAHVVAPLNGAGEIAYLAIAALFRFFRRGGRLVGR